MLVSAIVPSHARSEKLGVLLRALARQELPAGVELEAVIALDGEAEPVETPDGLDVRVLPVGRVGICAAKNAAVEASRGDLLLFLNDDVEPCERFVAEHLAAQRDGHPVVLGFSPWRRHDDQTVMDELIARTRMVFFYDHLRDGGDYDFRHAWNLNLSVCRDALAALDGPFNDALRPVYFDDIELAHRLMGPERRVRFCKAAVAVHDHRYTLKRYIEREALLGVMAVVLHEVNPTCYASIFRESPAALAEKAGPMLETDAPDHARIAEHLARRCAKPGRDEEGVIDTLYLLHLPLKRRAFRLGLMAALEQPDRPWRQRPAMAAEAVSADCVLGRLRDEVEPCLVD